MAVEDGDDAFFEQFRDEYDSFFDNEGAGAPPAGAASGSPPAGPSASKGGGPKVNGAASRPRGHSRHAASGSDATAGLAEAADIESEYEKLSTYTTPERHPNGAGVDSNGRRAPAEERPRPMPNGHAPTEYSMADDDDDDDVQADMDMVQSGFHQDLCLPELPAAPMDFTRADLVLRESLAAFYTKHCAERLPAVNAIVQQYRGRATATLWAQLALKYSVPAVEAVELLAGTLYLKSAFEHSDEHLADALDVELGRLQPDALDERQALVQEELERPGGSEELLRALCLRGPAGDLGDLRPLVWKVLLGHLPMSRRSEWNAIESERRALYATYRSEVLVVTSSHKIEVKVKGHRAMKTLDVLQQIQKDVERTRHECDSFRRPPTRVALSALLFVYAHRNPDTQYIQGMHEVAALLYHVFSVDPEAAEADTFWCLCAVMREIKAGLMQALAPESASGIAGQKSPPTLAAGVERLLKVYDPELFKHLQTYSCPLSVFTFRWCALLFAQDAALPDAVSFFECLIADPQRFSFVVHMSLAMLLERRDELLCTNEEGALAEVLRAAPRRASAAAVLRLARAICAFERRPQTPPFPVRSAAQLMQDLSGWAQKLGAGVARSLQDNVAPVVKDKAGQAAGRVGAAAKGGAQVVKEWLEQPEPIQPETIEKATAQVASLWQAVCSRGAAAVSKTRALAAEYSQPDRRLGGGASAEGAANAAAPSSSSSSSTAASGARPDSTLGGPSSGHGYHSGYHGGILQS